MQFIVQCLSIFALGLIGLGPAIPTGMAMGLPLVLVGLLAGGGAIVSSILILLVGEALRDRLLRMHKPRPSSKRSAAIRIVWEKYGIIGLGFLGPLLIGNHVATAIAVVMGVKRRQILFWVSLWTVMTTILFILFLSAGLDLLNYYFADLKISSLLRF